MIEENQCRCCCNKNENSNENLNELRDRIKKLEDKLK